MNDIPKKTVNMIGKTKTNKYDVTLKDIKRYAQAIDDPNPLFSDVDFAEKTVFKSIVAPPLFCQIFAFEDANIEELLPDGSPVEMNIPLPAKKTVGGSSSFDIYHRVKPGDKLTVKSCLKNLYSKEGKSGTLYFITVETEFYNQSDQLVARELAVFIKR